MDFGSIIIGVILTAIVYMAFPLIKLLTNGGKFNENKAHKIALWNSIILGVIFCIATSVITAGGTVWSAAPAVIYYWINRSILMNKNIQKSNEVPSATQTEKSVVSRPPQISAGNEKTTVHGNYNISGKNIAFQSTSASKSSICRNCGTNLFENNQFCHICGTKNADEIEKDYFSQTEETKLDKAENNRLFSKCFIGIAIVICLFVVVVFGTFFGRNVFESFNPQETPKPREKWEIILDEVAGVSVTPTPKPFWSFP